MHYLIVVSYKPLTHSLPLSLAHLSYGMPKETGHDVSVIGEYSEDHSSSTEHLNKPQRPVSPPASLGNGAQVSASSSYPAEKNLQSSTSNKQSNGQFVSEDAGTARDATYPPEGIEDTQYPATNDQPEGIRTSVGPPVGIPHTENLELGTIGQQPDPANESDDAEPYFAVPGGPGVQMLEEEDENDPNAFFHPATKEPMRILWLPRDELGLAEAEIERNAKLGITSVHRYATLNAKVGLNF